MRKSISGFTVVELLVVVVILGILATISVVAYGTIAANARDAKRKADVDMIAKHLQVYVAKHNALPVGAGTSTMLTLDTGAHCDTLLNTSATQVAQNMKNFSGCAMITGSYTNPTFTFWGALLRVTTENPEKWQAMMQQLPAVAAVRPTLTNRQHFCEYKNASGACGATNSWLAKGHLNIDISNIYANPRNAVPEMCMRILFMPENMQYQDQPSSSGTYRRKPYTRFVCTANFPNPPQDIIY